MADVVAIVSVATSGAVGITGIIAQARAGVTLRRWQSREERVAELRGVLDLGGETMATIMQNAATAHERVARTSTTPPPEHGVARGGAGAALNAALSAYDRIWVVSNRLQVRLGPESPVVASFEQAREAVGRLTAAVRREVARQELSESYARLWRTARQAEQAFYAASAETLASEAGRQSLLGRARSSGSPMSPVE